MSNKTTVGIVEVTILIEASARMRQVSAHSLASRSELRTFTFTPQEVHTTIHNSLFQLSYLCSRDLPCILCVKELLPSLLTGHPHTIIHHGRPTISCAAPIIATTTTIANRIPRAPCSINRIISATERTIRSAVGANSRAEARTRHRGSYCRSGRLDRAGYRYERGRRKHHHQRGSSSGRC